jgi:hypothetical protein
VRVSTPKPEDQALSLQQRIIDSGLEAKLKHLPDGVVVLVRREKLQEARALAKPVPVAEPAAATKGPRDRFWLIAGGASTLGALIGTPVGLLLRGTMIAGLMVSAGFAMCAFLMVMAISASRLSESSATQAPTTQAATTTVAQRPRSEERRRE